MKSFGAFEAKTRFGQLLDLVEAGEEIVITRRGRVVARMTSPDAAFDKDRSREAALRIRDNRKGVTLGDVSLKVLISEGRP